MDERTANLFWQTYESRLNPWPRIAGLRSTAQQIADSIHSGAIDGFSLTSSFKNFETPSYIVAYQGFERRIPVEQFSADSIMLYRRMNLSIFTSDPANLLGGWVSEGAVVLDVSRTFNDLSEALIFGSANAQEAIWDGFNKVVIPVPDDISHLRVARLKRQSSIDKMKMYQNIIFEPGLASEQDDGMQATASQQFPLPRVIVERAVQANECPHCSSNLARDDMGTHCPACGWDPTHDNVHDLSTYRKARGQN